MQLDSNQFKSFSRSDMIDFPFNVIVMMFSLSEVDTYSGIAQLNSQDLTELHNYAIPLFTPCQNTDYDSTVGSLVSSAFCLSMSFNIYCFFFFNFFLCSFLLALLSYCCSRITYFYFSYNSWQRHVSSFICTKSCSCLASHSPKF